MKLLKYSLIVIAALFVGVLIYANVRQYNPSEKFPQVAIAQFGITPIADSIQLKRIVGKVEAIPGVNSLTLNRGSNTAAVMYQTELTNPADLMIGLSDGGKIAVKENDLHGGGKTCPVMGPMARINMAIASLNFRK